METKFLPFLLGVVSALLLLITPPARAAGTIYTNASEFLAVLEDGYYTEYFSDFSNYSSTRTTLRSSATSAPHRSPRSRSLPTRPITMAASIT